MAWESHSRVLSCISYKKYTKKPAHGLPKAPSPELSAETLDCVIPNAVRDLDKILRHFVPQDDRAGLHSRPARGIWSL